MKHEFNIDYLDNVTTYDYAPNGALRVLGTIAKTGWLEYVNNDGTKRLEYVSPEVLFSLEHMDSIGGLPLTLGHPPEKLTPDNYRKYAVGSVGTKVVGDKDKGLIDVVLIVADAQAIEAIKSGETKQLSMGYEASIEENSDGTYNQTRRIGNHIALVQKARAGERAKVHFDGTDKIYGRYKADENFLIKGQEKNMDRNIEKESKMATIHHDGITIDVPNDIASTIRSWIEGRQETRQLTINLDGAEYEVTPEVKLKLDSIESAKNVLENENQSFKNEIKALELKIDELTTELEKAKITLDGSHDRLIARRNLERQAIACIPTITEKDLNVDDRTLKEFVILERLDCAEADIKDKSDSQIDGMFEASLLIKQDSLDNSRLSHDHFSRSDSNSSDSNFRYKSAKQVSDAWNWILK